MYVHCASWSSFDFVRLASSTGISHQFYLKSILNLACIPAHSCGRLSVCYTAGPACKTFVNSILRTCKFASCELASTLLSLTFSIKDICLHKNVRTMKVVNGDFSTITIICRAHKIIDRNELTHAHGVPHLIITWHFLKWWNLILFRDHLNVIQAVICFQNTTNVAEIPVQAFSIWSTFRSICTLLKNMYIYLLAKLL